MNFFYNQARTFSLFLGILSLLTFWSLDVVAANVAEKEITQPITIAVNKTSYPYHAVDLQGNAIGLMPDLWRLWAKKQNVEIKFVTMNWLDTLKQVSSGSVDIHAGLSITDKRKEHFLFAKPLFSIYSHFYVNQSLRTVDSIAALKPYSIGVIKGSAHVESLKVNHPELTFKTYDSRSDLYQAALDNEILVFTGLEKLADDFDGYERLKQRFPINKVLLNDQSPYGVAVAKNNEKLLSFIEQGFEKTSKEERAFIERKWLALGKQKDSLLVTYPPNYPPYVGISLLGEAQGMMIDVWRLWSKHVGIHVEFAPQDMRSSIGLIADKKADVSLFYPINMKISDSTVFADSFYESDGQVFISEKVRNQQGKKLFSLSELAPNLEKYTFGVWENSTLKERLLLQYPNLNVRYFNSVNELLTAAETGEISGMVGFVDILYAKLVEANLQTLFYRLADPVITTRLAPVLHADNKKLLQIINQGFSELDLKDLIEIETQWLKGAQGDYFFKKQAAKTALSNAEKNFIKQHDSFNLGVVKDLSPIEFISEKGNISGINADFIELIKEKTGMQFNLVEFDTWSHAYKALVNNKIDVLGGITETEARKNLMLFSDNYWQMPLGIIHHQAQGRKSKLSDYYGKEVAVVKGSYLIDKIMKEHPQLKFKIVNKREDAINELQQHNVDGFMTSIASASHFLRKEENINLMMSIMEGVPPETSHFAINSNLPMLKNILNKSLLSITDREKQKIYDDWLTIEIKTGLDSRVVWQNAAKVSVVFLVILIIILIWNRRLKIEVAYRQKLENKMKHMATHDELTGLANRVLLQDRLDTAIAFHKRQSLKLAVLFIDLDGFKNVNDTHGHDIGDELLQQVAHRFQGCVRSSDTVVRFGGDEFVLLLTGLRTLKEASNVAEKVLKVIQKEFELSKATAEVGCSIGISMYPDDADNTRDLLKISDTLMYKVKAEGKNHYMFN